MNKKERFYETLKLIYRFEVGDRVKMNRVDGILDEAKGTIDYVLHVDYNDNEFQYKILLDVELGNKQKYAWADADELVLIDEPKK